MRKCNRSSAYGFVRSDTGCTIIYWRIAVFSKLAHLLLTSIANIAILVQLTHAGELLLASLLLFPAASGNFIPLFEAAKTASSSA